MLAAMLVLAHLVDSFWLVLPAWRPTGFAIAWSDLLAVVALGGIWLALFIRTATAASFGAASRHTEGRAIGHA